MNCRFIPTLLRRYEKDDFGHGRELDGSEGIFSSKTFRDFGLVLVLITAILNTSAGAVFALHSASILFVLPFSLFVAVIFTMGDMESWFYNFDKPEPEIPADNILGEEGRSLGRIIGVLFGIGNMLCLCLLFTSSLTILLSPIGIEIALGISFFLAFTAGLLTESSFYITRMAETCGDIGKWIGDKIGNFFIGIFSLFINEYKPLEQTPTASTWSFAGTFTFIVGQPLILTYAFVHGATFYAGILAFPALLGAVNLFVPGIAIIATVAALVGFVGGYILGLNFLNLIVGQINESAALDPGGLPDVEAGEKVGSRQEPIILPVPVDVIADKLNKAGDKLKQLGLSVLEPRTGQLSQG